MSDTLPPPHLPDPNTPRPDVKAIGSPHATIRDEFMDGLRLLTDAAEYTDTVFASSSDLKRLGELGVMLAHDHERLESTTKIDHKTGLINFGTAQLEVERATNDRQRQVEKNPELADIPFGFYAFLDIDNFKQVNKVLTNPVVDSIILKQVGASLNRSMENSRMGDMAMRHGGDEFGLWFNNVLGSAEDARPTTQTQFEKVVEIARKLQADVNAGLREPMRGLSMAQLEELGEVTFSFGFVFPTIRQVRQVQAESGLSASDAIFTLATRQEQIAKVDKTTTTIAVNGAVYDVMTNQKVA